MMTTLRGPSMVDRKKPTKEKRLRSSAPYSSKIIKAGALIGDTKTLLSHWDVTAPVGENINRVQRDNVFGKASRSRVEDILAIFRQRYLTEESVTRALVTRPTKVEVAWASARVSREITLPRGLKPTLLGLLSGASLVALVRGKFPTAALERLLYFHHGGLCEIPEPLSETEGTHA